MQQPAGDILRTLCFAIICNACMLRSAAAMGDIYLRVASWSNISSCQGAEIIESLYEGGNVRGYTSHLTVACLQGDNTARWVLISGTGCSNDTAEDLTKLNPCESKWMQDVPSLIVDEEFRNTKGKKPPYEMEYELIKWGFGTNCTAASQTLSSYRGDDAAVGGTKGEYEGTDMFWLCEKLATYDGTYSGEIGNLTPKTFKTHKIKLSAEKPMTSLREDGKLQELHSKLPSRFAVDSSKYEYYFRESPWLE